MYTYTFSHEHFANIMSHISGLQITVTSLQLTAGIYTMVCQTQVDADQYEHLNQYFGLQEVV
jgi:hypothetical protein